MTQNRELFTMKKIVLILILIVLLTGCSKSTPVGTQSGGETPTPDLAPPEVQTTKPLMLRKPRSSSWNIGNQVITWLCILC